MKRQKNSSKNMQRGRKNLVCWLVEINSGFFNNLRKYIQCRIILLWRRCAKENCIKIWWIAFSICKLLFIQRRSAKRWSRARTPPQRQFKRI